MQDESNPPPRCLRIASTTFPTHPPQKPGLIRCANGAGAAIEVEVWEMPVKEFGSFVALVSPPLTIGTIEVSGIGPVKGFLCESYAVEHARDISNHDGWRQFLKSR